MHRLRIWLGTAERTYSLLLLLWPFVALVIAVLAIRLVSTAKELADLISAVASLTWPLVALAIVGWFRPEIRAILSRIRKGKFLGTEFELDELQAKAEVAEAKAELSTGTMIQASAGFQGSGTLDAVVAEDAVEEVLREASRSPRLGLMLLSAKMEEVLDLGRHAGVLHGLGGLVRVHHHGPLEVRHGAEYRVPAIIVCERHRLF